MTTLPTYITTSLRFPTEEILCKGDRWQLGCKAADGQAGYAIHTFDGKHYCAYHSPLDNRYAPCAECGEKPTLMTSGDRICDDCRKSAAGHICDEATERAAYQQYVSDGLADTDGHFAPESFEAWQAHHHRAIGYEEPRTAECTDTECKAPAGERVKCVQDRLPGKRRKFHTYSICRGCHDRRQAARVVQAA